MIVNGTSDRVKGAVEELSTLPGQVHGIEADVGDFSECRALVEKTLERWGRIDILINNAGDEPARFNRVMSELDPSPDGHPKLLHSWPPKVLQAGRVNYAGSEAMARRAEASFRR